jgi:pimeloyl-ACP methyl ester carboxylesterase
MIPSQNRNKVAMEFEMDAEAIAVASLGQLKVIKVNYRGGGPSIPGNEDIVAVYRELLKTYKPKNIGMFGASGGCTLAQTTAAEASPSRRSGAGHLLGWIESGRCPVYSQRARRWAVHRVLRTAALWGTRDSRAKTGRATGDRARWRHS